MTGHYCLNLKQWHKVRVCRRLPRTGFLICYSGILVPFFFKYVDQYALAKILEENGELFILKRGVINHIGDFARAIKEQYHQAETDRLVLFYFLFCGPKSTKLRISRSKIRGVRDLDLLRLLSKLYIWLRPIAPEL